MKIVLRRRGFSVTYSFSEIWTKIFGICYPLSTRQNTKLGKNLLTLPYALCIRNYD